MDGKLKYNYINLSLSINGLNIPIKKEKLSIMIKKQHSNAWYLLNIKT